MPIAIIGQTYTFSVLFLDGSNNPIAATGTTARVFRFNSLGAEIAVAAGSMGAVSGDPGRFAYTFTIPTSLGAGETLFAVMSGIDPGSLTAMIVEDSVDLTSNPQSSGGGIIARFIR